MRRVMKPTRSSRISSYSIESTGLSAQLVGRTRFVLLSCVPRLEKCFESATSIIASLPSAPSCSSSGKIVAASPLS